MYVYVYVRPAYVCLCICETYVFVRPLVCAAGAANARSSSPPKCNRRRKTSLQATHPFRTCTETPRRSTLGRTPPVVKTGAHSKENSRCTFKREFYYYAEFSNCSACLYRETPRCSTLGTTLPVVKTGADSNSSRTQNSKKLCVSLLRNTTPGTTVRVVTIGSYSQMKRNTNVESTHTYWLSLSFTFSVILSPCQHCPPIQR